MPRKSISEPVWDKSRKRWKVDVPASISDTGQRSRAFFKTRELARDYISKVQPGEGKETVAVIPPTLAVEADKARGIIEPWGLDLVQAARTVSNSLSLLNGTGATIKQACQFYAAHHAKQTASKPVGEAVAQYLDARSDLRESTLSSYRYTLERTLAPLHSKTLASVSEAELEALLKDKASTAKSLHLRNLGAFWRWASKPPRRWSNVEVFDALEPARISRDADIKILSPKEAKALLTAAEEEGSAAAVAFAIALFAGVRMGELERLAWSDVKEDHIEIGKAVAKKSARRYIPISPTLRAWLDAYSASDDSSSLIVPANWKEVSRSTRRRAGWNVVARLLKSPPDPTRGAWPANALRHTCASIHVAIGTPLESLIFQFGHSGTHETLKRHYARRMTKKDAETILRIIPRLKD